MYNIFYSLFLTKLVRPLLLKELKCSPFLLVVWPALHIVHYLTRDFVVTRDFATPSLRGPITYSPQVAVIQQELERMF